MNHDLDVVSRVVDYHDHISTPSVPVTDDLRRGRRRVRRQRSLVAGGVALGVASVVAAVSLATGADSGDHTEPVGPSTSHSTSGPSPDGVGLTAPLVAPKPLRDVRDLGFHVEPVPGFDPEGLGGGWAIDDEGQTVTLRWGEVADEVTVKVRYHGAPPPEGVDTDPNSINWDHQEEVTIHGAVGRYFEEHDLYGIGGSFKALVAWEYAPDSWAYVSTYSDRGDPGPERLRSALIHVAQAVSAGGEPVRLPLRTDALPSSLPPLSKLVRVSMTMGTGWEPALDFGHLRFTVGPGVVPRACEGYDGGVETFTYRGHAGCLNGYGTPDRPSPGTSFSNVYAVALTIGDTVRTVEVDPGDEYPIADLKRALADLTVAPLNHESTWFDLKTALGGGEAGRSS